MCLRPKVTNSNDCLVACTLKRDGSLGIREGRHIDVCQQSTQDLHNLIIIDLNLDAVSSSFPGKVSNLCHRYLLQECVTQSHQITALATLNKHSRLNKCCFLQFLHKFFGTHKRLF